MSPKILFLDDEPKLGELAKRALAREGYDVRCETDPHAALEALKSEPFDVLITDLRMPALDGLEVLKRAKAIRPLCEVIMITAYSTVDTAIEALKRGAIDYVQKPFSMEDQILPLLRRIFAADPGAPPASSSAPSRSASAPPGDPLARIVTASPAMLKIIERLPRIAAATASILLRGESGTGKEVLANALQALSSRAHGPFVKINCGALPETLLESELFGHIKGAFTGSVADRAGLFESADKGTIFLDEIGEVSPGLQVKLLRVLQEGEFQRVGDSKTRRADVRIIAATNRDLEAMMREGDFRQDLFYRLNVVPIHIPPLRERREDIPPLIEHFSRRFCPGRKVAYSPEAHQALLSYPWPGNIRELENAIEHALVLGDPDLVQIADLPVALQDFQAHEARAAGPQAVGQATLEEIERRCILSALEKTGFNQTHAARLLGITRRTLGYRIRKYDLEEEIERRRAESRA